jgi:hypothetical protein
MAENLAGISDEELDAVLDQAYQDTPEETQGEDTNLGSQEEPTGSEPDVSPVETDTDESGESDQDSGDAQSGEEEREEDESGSTGEDTPSSDEGEEPVEEDVSEDGNSEPEGEKDSEPAEKLHPIKANGKEYPIESMDELYRLASMGISAHQKWEAAAEGRKLSKMLKSNGLSIDDVNLLVDIKKGDKAAIANLLKESGVDPLDLDVEASTGYAPKDYSPSDIELRVEDVVERVKTKPKFEETVNVIMEQWDERSREAFFEKPEILELLNVDMQPDPETGVSMYDRVAPLAEKLKALDGGVKSDIEYYIEAGNQVVDSINKSKESKTQAKQKATIKKQAQKKKIEQKKKVAAPSKNAGTSSVQPKGFSEMTDEELDKWLSENL